MCIYPVILGLLISYNVTASQGFFDGISSDVIKYSIVAPHFNHSDIYSLKRTCTFFNKLFHHYMLDPVTIKNIPEKICTKALISFAKNNLADNFNTFFHNNDQEKRQEAVTLLGWNVKNEGKNAYCQGIKNGTTFYWDDISKNSIALDIAFLMNAPLKDIDEDTGLMFAYDNGYEEAVELLHDSDLNTQNIYGDTTLIYAASNNDIEGVKFLLTKEKVDLNIKNKKGDTALIVASREGYPEIVKLLICNEKVILNIKNNDGLTANDYAVKYSQYDYDDVYGKIVELLQNALLKK